ncbi:hypothetical protein BS47DRAFT_1490388 [Hydnum rufescens UP504]|uniref:Uncharacterized protein n=1 Tax=Hydnum rufescens UP504 TaxID=1448309 RepID=A0A9P6AEX5_9AGAM|nr:hypothetical protein BS47DRAFT_1490388 [Hydnum rufescens UP504]
MADKPGVCTSKCQQKPTEKAMASVVTTTVSVESKSLTKSRLASHHLSILETNPLPSHATPTSPLLTSLSMPNKNTKPSLAVPSATIRMNEDEDGGDSEEGDDEEGGGDSDDEDGGGSPDSVPLRMILPSISSPQRPQKSKPGYSSADTHSLDDAPPQTKRNRINSCSLDSDESPVPDISAQSPQFGTLSPLKSAAARDNSTPYPSSYSLTLSNEDSEEMILSIPDTLGSNTLGLSGGLRRNWLPLSRASIHDVEGLPSSANSKKCGPVLNTTTHVVNVAPTMMTVIAQWLRDQFLEDLGVLADKSQYPRLKLLKAAELRLVNHAEVDKEKGQCEKNAFNGWSWSYMKEAPNPPQGKQGNYMKEVVTPAWYAFKTKHETIGDLDEQLCRLRAKMVMVEIDDLKRALEGAGLSHLMDAEQDGMVAQAKTLTMAGAHTIILMVSGRAHDDKSVAQNGIFYGSDAARWFWTSINNPLGNIIWQFYIFVNSDAIRLQQVELNPEVAQASKWHAKLADISKAKAASGKHLRALFILEEWFPWQSLPNLLYGHQLEIINWGVMPGFANLHRNASNSVISWHLLCSKFHKAPSNIVIGVHRWSTGDAKMSLEAQAAVAIMTDCNGGILMRVSSSQRYLEDAKDMQDPAVAVARRGKCPIPGKPEGRGKKHGRAARAATTTIPAHSAVSVDSPVITDDTEPNATAASNVNVPESLLTTGGIEASPAPVELPLVTHTDAPALSHMSIPLDINGNISAPQDLPSIPCYC